MTTTAKRTDRPAAASLARQLQDAKGFVEVGLVTCEAARARDLDCSIALLSLHGHPLLTVEYRSSSERVLCHSVPIVALTENIGAIQWSAEEPLDDRHDELANIGLHVSVRMAQLGHTSCVDEVDALSARQAETASMAARGFTNSEIARHLGVSENTIKKHIGEVFARLHIGNRTELALRFSRLATIDLVPMGVTYVREYRIIRRGVMAPLRTNVTSSRGSGRGQAAVDDEHRAGRERCGVRE